MVRKEKVGHPQQLLQGFADLAIAQPPPQRDPYSIGLHFFQLHYFQQHYLGLHVVPFIVSVLVVGGVEVVGVVETVEETVETVTAAEKEVDGLTV